MSANAEQVPDKTDSTGRDGQGCVKASKREVILFKAVLKFLQGADVPDVEMVKAEDRSFKSLVKNVRGEISEDFFEKHAPYLPPVNSSARLSPENLGRFETAYMNEFQAVVALRTHCIVFSKDQQPQRVASVSSFIAVTNRVIDEFSLDADACFVILWFTLEPFTGKTIIKRNAPSVIEGGAKKVRYSYSAEREIVDIFEQAAKKSGISRNEWMNQACLRMARDLGFEIPESYLIELTGRRGDF